MAEATNQGAAAPIRKTKFTRFFSCNPNQDALFAVNGDIGADDALEMASTFLAVAEDCARKMTMKADSEAYSSVLYLIEISRALVNSTITSIADEESGHV